MQPPCPLTWGVRPDLSPGRTLERIREFLDYTRGPSSRLLQTAAVWANVSTTLRLAKLQTFTVQSSATENSFVQSLLNAMSHTMSQ